MTSFVSELASLKLWFIFNQQADVADKRHLIVIILIHLIMK